MVIAGAAAFATTGCADTAKPDDSANATTFAALAVVPGQGRNFHGYAKRATATDARTEAKKKCENTKCKIIHEYKSGQCVHLVIGDDQIYWNEAPYTEIRRQEILDFCGRIDENCQVIVSECLP